ncbi:TPA: ead/Ea22-like family protein [Klebsiella pneumoniae]|nr:ead/Ea22-like family protein [Klebsiella pneumoniae]HCQ6635780.1 ead/Ea22-like family protein [Klebsiella pneumoniae]
MTDITELAQSLKAAAIDAKELAIIARYSKGRAAAEKFYAMANPANILALVKALEKAQQRIAQLESRTVKLPKPYAYLRENDGQIQISIGAERPSDRSGGYATPWFAIYTAAGSKVETE